MTVIITTDRFCPEHTMEGNKLDLARDGFLRVQENVDDIKDKLGINYDIEICPATKTVDAQTINSLVPFGLKHIGENKMQELESKYEQYSPELSVDFIGTLQSNKVRSLVGKVRMIQSLSTLSAAKEIQRVCQNRGCVQSVLIEINSACEENKSGVLPEEFEEFAACVSEMDRIKLCGVMTVGAFVGDEAQYAKYFTLARELFEKNRRYFSGDIISMGMSDNYELAIKCGSTLIRPGRVIFGERNYNKS